MASVRLRGQLICHDDRDAALVAKHLPLHAELSRAEDGCISFEVSPTEDPLVWKVDEVFADAAAFMTHQNRVTDSEWGRATAAIERRYVTEGV